MKQINQIDTATTAVDVASVTVGYGAVPVVTDINLQLAPQRICAILGPSGSGKTTILRTVAGFLRPDRGTIRLGGVLVSGNGAYLPPERRSLGLVPQEGALFPHLSVAGNIGFGLPRRTKADRAATRDRVNELLDLVSLQGRGKMQPHELSGGMQQRVALARALARRPQTVLLDEPFSSLDTQLRAELQLQVRQLILKSGAGAILVTHDQNEAQAMADDIYLMSSTAPATLTVQSRT